MASSFDRFFHLALVFSTETGSTMLSHSSMWVEKTLQHFHVFVIDLFIIIGTKKALLHKFLIKKEYHPG